MGFSFSLNQNISERTMTQHRNSLQISEIILSDVGKSGDHIFEEIVEHKSRIEENFISEFQFLQSSGFTSLFFVNNFIKNSFFEFRNFEDLSEIRLMFEPISVEWETLSRELFEKIKSHSGDLNRIISGSQIQLFNFLLSDEFSDVFIDHSKTFTGDDLICNSVSLNYQFIVNSLDVFHNSWIQNLLFIFLNDRFS